MKRQTPLVALLALGVAVAAPSLATAQAPAPAPAARPARPAPAGAAARLDALQARVDALEALRAEHGEMSKSLDATNAEIQALRQEIAALKAGAGNDAAIIGRLDELDGRVARLGESTATLRADLDARTSPEAASQTGGAHADDKGIFVFESDKFQLRVNAFAQLRWQGRYAENPDREPRFFENSFRVRRARMTFAGYLHDKRLGYAIQTELSGSAVSLLDAYVDIDVGSGFSVRAGQMKVPFSRIVLASDQQMSFGERPVMAEELGYERDIGATVTWKGLDGKLGITAGAFNGAGRGQSKNDNTDMYFVGRAEMFILGKPWRDEGDWQMTKDPGLMVGVAGSFENAPVPGFVGFKGAPIEVNTDVDGDGIRDNVTVSQVGFELSARWLGLSFDGELVLRKEDWGAIGDGQDPPFTPEDTLMGWFAQAEYFVWPEHLQVGARVSITDVSPVLVQRQRTEADLPIAEEKREYSGLLSYHRFGHGFELSLTYSFIDWDSDADLGKVGEHRFILETQFSY
jgi:hypothetical protein